MNSKCTMSKRACVAYLTITLLTCCQSGIQAISSPVTVFMTAQCNSRVIGGFPFWQQDSRHQYNAKSVTNTPKLKNMLVSAHTAACKSGQKTAAWRCLDVFLHVGLSVLVRAACLSSNNHARVSGLPGCDLPADSWISSDSKNDQCLKFRQ